jgi:hypothetical protein
VFPSERWEAAILDHQHPEASNFFISSEFFCRWRHLLEENIPAAA